MSVIIWNVEIGYMWIVEVDVDGSYCFLVLLIGCYLIIVDVFGYV